MDKTKYVCGFVFNQNKILTILKQKGPSNLIGKLNGVGGKVEPLETYLQAMQREFIEETSCIKDMRWRYRLDLELKYAKIKFFWSTVDILNDVLIPEKEPLYWYDLKSNNEFELVDDLKYIMPLILEKME